MSLALAALRLAAVAALGSHPAIAAACGPRVFDSRLADLDHREPLPVIVVTTEELEGDALSANNGGAPFLDACNLCLEIAVNAISEEDGATNLWVPATDPELEATIDTLADAAEIILTVGLTPEAALVRKVTRRCTRRTSSRFASDQTGEKLAIRLLTFRMELKSWQPDDPRTPPTGPFATLPEPLRTVAAALPVGSAGRLTCQMIAAKLAVPTFTPLAGVDITLAPRPAIDPAAIPAPPAPGETGPTFGNVAFRATPDSL